MFPFHQNTLIQSMISTQVSVSFSPLDSWSCWCAVCGSVRKQELVSVCPQNEWELPQPRETRDTWLVQSMEQDQAFDAFVRAFGQDAQHLKDSHEWHMIKS